MNYFYADKNKKPIGPYTFDEMRHLAIVGDLKADDYVIAEGDDNWRRWEDVAESVRRSGSESASPSAAERLTAIRTRGHGWLQNLNHRYASAFRRRFQIPRRWGFQRREGFRGYLETLGQWSALLTVASAAMLSILLVISAIRFDSTFMAAAALLILVVGFLLQHLSGIFAEANLRLLFGEPIPLLSKAVPQSILILGGLVAMISVGLSVWGCVGAFQSSFAAGVIATIFSIGFGAYALHIPWLAANAREFLNVQDREDVGQSAADYLCNLFRLVGRLGLALIPIKMACVLSAILLLLIFVAIKALTGSASLSDLADLAPSRSHASPSFDDFSAPSFGAILLLLPLAGLQFVAILWNTVALLVLPVIGHFSYLLLVFFADLGAGFFRLMESVLRLERLTAGSLQPADGQSSAEASASTSGSNGPK